MIACEHLTKRFGAQTVVDDLTFRCDPGRVVGFLGPNGAGKSTTMRMICGLAPPTSGTATIDGRRYDELTNPAHEIGVLLDASAVHPGRSGRETLALAAATMGVPSTRAAEVLDVVGLTAAAGRKRVGNYSLGMRQRLGIAVAMLGEPRTLILDEPANGLDPEGIRWMRDLLRDFADGGGTVLLSSHLLKEVEAVADTLVIINRGRLIAAGTAREIVGGATGAGPEPATLVRASDLHGLAAALEQAGIWWTYAADGEAMLTDADAASVGAAALHGGVALSELRAHEAAGAGLEDLFLSLTADPDHEPAEAGRGWRR